MKQRGWYWVALVCSACGNGSSTSGGAPPVAEPEAPSAPAPGAEIPDVTAAGAEPLSPVSDPGTGAEQPVPPTLAAPNPLPASGGGSPDASAPGPARELPADAATLTVSLTFDDSFLPQVRAAAVLEAHGLRGTFYVNSPRLHEGTANPSESIYMSIADALGLEARGHEVGGHTLSHPQLTLLPEAERVREIMGDRAELARLGLSPRSLAYPTGAVEADADPSLGRSVLEVTGSSGYANARDTNGVSLNDCAAGTESIPPVNPFRVRSIRSVNDAPPVAEGEPPLPPDTAATLLAWMDHAASCAQAPAPAWLPLIFHHLRDDCAAPDGPGSFCFSFAELERLSAALATGSRCPDDPAASCYRIAVAPVSALIDAAEPAPAPPVLALRNPSLERTLASGNAECLQRSQGTGGTALFERVEGQARSGQASERMQVGAENEVAAELRISRDFGACAPFATPGQSYDLSLFYQAEPAGALPALRFVTYRLTSDYVWEAWQSQPIDGVVAGEWVQQSFSTEPTPPGTIAFSFGLRLESAGAVQVDDLAASAAGAAL